MHCASNLHNQAFKTFVFSQLTTINLAAFKLASASSSGWLSSKLHLAHKRLHGQLLARSEARLASHEMHSAWRILELHVPCARAHLRDDGVHTYTKRAGECGECCEPAASDVAELDGSVHGSHGGTGKGEIEMA